VVESTEHFSTGRRKYHAIFYDEESKVISKHLAMRLLNSSGNAYMVCQRAPLRQTAAQTRAAPAQAIVSSNNAPVQVSGIVIQNPKPTLTCAECAMPHTVERSMLSCLNCSGHNFVWSCACAQLTASTTAATTSSTAATRTTTAATATHVTTATRAPDYDQYYA